MKSVALVRVEAGGEPVDHHVVDVALDDLALFVVRGQRVPVGDEEEALVLVLQAHPVLERAVVVAEVHARRSAACPERTRLARAPAALGRCADGSSRRGRSLIDGGAKGVDCRYRPGPRRYTARADEEHRHPHLGPRLQHGGDRARLRRASAGRRASPPSSATAPTRPGWRFARERGIATAVVDHRAFASRDAFDDALARRIEAHGARPRRAGRLHAHPRRRASCAASTAGC